MGCVEGAMLVAGVPVLRCSQYLFSKRALAHAAGLPRIGRGG